MSDSIINTVGRANGMPDFPGTKTIPLDRSAMKSPSLEEPKQEGFGDLLKELVGGVNELQHEAAAREEAFLKGEITDVHQVMIAAEEASVAFDLLMEIRNKLLDSYKEIMRMQA